MYHCAVVFYCVGRDRSLFKTLEELPPLERFSHTFMTAEEVQPALAAQADVILADLAGLDDPAALAEIMKPSAQLIVLAERTQLPRLQKILDRVWDVWIMPMDPWELRFRFQRWQRSCRQDRDLWQSRQFLDAAMDASPDLIWLKDREGVHEKVNLSFCRTVGKERSQVEGRSHAYIWDVEKDDPAFIESERQVMERREATVSDETIQTGGGVRQLTTYRSPLYDWDDSVMGTVNVGVDVTRERAFEQQLLQKNHVLEKLFTTMECGVLCHTVDGSRVLSINRAALRLLGYRSLQELEENGFDTVASSVMDEDKPKLRHCIQSLHDAGDCANIEYRVRHRDGKVLHLMGNIKLMEENGEWYYQRFLVDCTAQKLRERDEHDKMSRRVHYQEQLFSIFSAHLSNNTDDVYMMVDRESKSVEYVSPNVYRVLGIRADQVGAELFGRGAGCGGDVNTVTLEELEGLELGMSLEARETERVNRKTGQHKWFRESVYCIMLDGRRKIVFYISDRTQERTAQATLAQALEAAKVANKAKSDFLSSVSHDIRTPMHAITGFVTLLREEAGDRDRVLEYTQRIDAASQHLLGLINDVLDMNKIESGGVSLNVAELELADVVEELNTIIRPQAKAKEQTFTIHVSSIAHERLLGDRLRIGQVLINILSNAVKYTRPGGTISLSVQELPQAADRCSRIRFVVSDNGQGMSGSYQKVIFDPFTREQNTLTNQIQGTGLGMAITKQLVDLMGGTIRLKSELGVGSTFTVELDLQIAKREAGPEFWDRYHIRRMLVAEEDPDDYASIVQSLERIGISVERASNGQEAVELALAARDGAQRCDAVLLNWTLPGLDGREIGRRLRKLAPEQRPLLFFTAYDWRDIEGEAMEIGLEHFLPKPFFLSTFRTAVHRSLGHRADPTALDKVVDGLRILVVDDIDVNRILLMKILTSLGASCDSAEDGKAALDKFTASAPGTYDLIMMDIQMPVMDGHAATREIRSCGRPDAKTVPIVAMTANAFVDDVRNALEAGMDAHIAKPVVLEQMKATLRDVLSSRR